MSIDEDDPVFATEQAFQYPDALAKACHDPFEYAVGLVSGLVVSFTEANHISREWVHLSGIVSCEPGPLVLADRTILFDRGLDVQVSQIVWVCDAPHGS